MGESSGMLINMSVRRSQIPHDITYICILKNKINENIKLKHTDKTGGLDVARGEGVKELRGRGEWIKSNW